MVLERTKLLLIIILVAIFSSVGGWLASTQILSPADIALRSEAPTPSLIFAPVEKRVLSSNIVTRGTARYGLPQTISAAPSPLKENAGVISALPIPGVQLNEGEVLVSASGRPIFVLRGKVPVYRDLGPGMSGDDIFQLEQGLKRLGFFAGQVNNIYDRKTSLAVSKWYASRGWEAFKPTRKQLANVREIEQRRGEANKRMLEAISASTIAGLAVESARATASYRNSAAALEVQEQLAARYLIVLDPRQQEAARYAAESKLKLALSGVDKTKLEGEIVIQEALDASKLAEFNVNQEKQLLKKLTRELSMSRERLGVQVPADEIVFLPSLPVRVKELLREVGDPALGPLMTVTNNRLTIDSSLTLNSAPLVKTGMPVTIEENALGISTSGTVERIAQSPGTFGVDGYHIYFAVSVAKTTMKIDGVSLRLTIPVKSTGGAVLAVPISALSLSTDGRSRIQVKTHDGVKYMEVEAGLSADGYVEIIPVSDTLDPQMQVVIGYEKS